MRESRSRQPSKAVKDAYTGLKERIQRKYGSPPSLESLEKKPESEAKRSSVTEDLRKGGADEDAETLEQAKALLNALMLHAPEVAAATGIDLNKIEADYLNVKDIIARGGQATGGRVVDGKFRNGIVIEGVRAEAGEGPGSKKP